MPKEIFKLWKAGVARLDGGDEDSDGGGSGPGETAYYIKQVRKVPIKVLIVPRKAKKIYIKCSKYKKQPLPDQKCCFTQLALLPLRIRHLC